MTTSQTTSSTIATKGLLALAFPIFIEHLLHVSTGMVDTFMVSHISDGAVAALGTASHIVGIFIVLFGVISLGTSVVVTHYLGAKDKAGADAIASTAIGVNTWIGLITSVLVYFAAEPLLKLMQLSPALREYAVPFLTLMGGTLFLESMNLSISAVLRAHGHTRDPMGVVIGQNILNVIGNAVLLFGLFGAPKMGVVGVAMSTVFSRFVACVVLWVLLDYRIKLRLRARDFFNVSRDRLKRILHIGLPAAAEQVSWMLAMMTVTAFTARLGDHELATQQYAFQLVWIVVLASVAIGLATEIIIGHLVGAGQFEEAYRQALRSLRVGFSIAIAVAIFVALAAKPLLEIFTHDAAIISTGVILMRIGILLEPGRVFNLVVINALRAAGDARYPVMMGAVSMWGVMAFGSWLLGTHFGLGVIGVWIAMGLDEWLRGILMYRRWKQRRWLKYAQHTHQQMIQMNR